MKILPPSNLPKRGTGILPLTILWSTRGMGILPFTIL